MMRPMPVTRSFAPLFMFVLGVAAAVLAVAAGPAEAAKKKNKYFFELAEVKAADALGKTGKDLIPVAQTQVGKSISTHEQIVTELAGAPDRANAKAFKAYLKKKKVAGAYRVNVEVIAFEEEIEEKDDSLNKEKRLIIRLSLRTFGETIPDRVMGFSGEGSATVKLDIGKKLRPKDREYAINQAVELAMTDALASSMQKLAKPPPPPKK
jgi:hypothetical protein